VLRLAVQEEEKPTGDEDEEELDDEQAEPMDEVENLKLRDKVSTEPMAPCCSRARPPQQQGS